MALHHCKTPTSRHGAVWLAACGLLALSACSAPLQRMVSLQSLEDSNLQLAHPLGQVMVDRVDWAADVAPLGSRLALCQVRTPDDWAALQAHHPGLGPCPDLQNGTVVGLASRVGQPLSGRWPLRIEHAQVSGGAILLTAHFEGGTYLPDGTTYLDLAYVPHGQQVLVVDINGVRYYLD